MSKKLSLKSLKAIVTQAGEKGMPYDKIVEALDAQQVAYTSELTLQGMIDESVQKGNFVRIDDGKDISKGTFAPKPRQTSGGGTPTHMYKLKDPLKPEKAEFVEKPYDKEVVENEDMWQTTKLAAVKAAKKHFYQTVYWPTLEQFRLLEESLRPASKDEDDPAEGEDPDSAAA